jgi:myo-inositol-1(or 4)-monophosphatase
MNNVPYFDQLQDVMIRSGQLVMQYFKKDVAVFEKNSGSIVTAVDFENEKFLKDELAKIMPQAGFWAEESGITGAQADWMWVIDPLDGTKNFVKGLPHFCIMVALTYKNDPIVSAIYIPVFHEFYYAHKNQGAWRNGVCIKFADRSIKHNVALVDCSVDDMRKIKLKLKENKIQISRRYFGSAGIDAVYLATGVIDLIAFCDIAWWDVAAGILLIQESGGLVSDYQKSVKKIGYGTLRAGNKLFFDDFL